jgi:phosphate transport system protein
MSRDALDRELDALEAGVLDLGGTVTDRLREAVRALDEGDRTRARVVLEGDHEINEQYLELESDCIDIFTLQQPVATDLRFVAASFKILTDLERVGDLAMNLGGYVVDMTQGFVPRADLVAIGDLVADQLEAALAAYEDRDPAACHAVAERDDEVDGLCERAADLLVRDLVERDPGDPELRMEELLNEAFQLLLTIRELERIGDHAVNVAARTLYLVENDDGLLY